MSQPLPIDRPGGNLTITFPNYGLPTAPEPTNMTQMLYILLMYYVLGAWCGRIIWKPIYIINIFPIAKKQVFFKKPDFFIITDNSRVFIFQPKKKWVTGLVGIYIYTWYKAVYWSLTWLEVPYYHESCQEGCKFTGFPARMPVKGSQTWHMFFIFEQKLWMGTILNPRAIVGDYGIESRWNLVYMALAEIKLQVFGGIINHFHTHTYC
jgi:hypothetical protein